MHLTNIMASSLDGKISTSALESDLDRKQYGFINEDDQNLLRNEVSLADAMIVGAQTVRANNQLFELKNTSGQYPSWVIFTRNGLGQEHFFWKQKHAQIILVSPTKLEKKDYWTDATENIAYEQKPPGVFVLNYLQSKNLQKLLLFGGGEINRIFYNENLVDSLLLTIAPMFIGKSSASQLVDPELASLVHFDLISLQASTNHVFLKYNVKK